MAAWVTDEEKDEYPLELRFHASMAGALGVGGNLLVWSDEDCARAAQHVARFKELRPTITRGDLYRLRSPHAGAFSAFMHVAKDRSEAVLFAFRMHEARLVRNPLIRLAGLEPEALYTVEGINGARTGRAWAELGLRLPLKDFQSTILKIQKE